MTRVALYARVSTSEQATEGTSIESQRQKLRVHAEVHDWTVVGEYVDRGSSGTTDDRQDLQRLMRDVQASRCDIVAVWKLDRFFRKLGLLLQYKEKLDGLGVAFVTISDGVDTANPMGRLVFNILGSIAEWEREEIVARTREGRYTRYRAGEWGPGQPLYGYKYNTETRKLEIREDEAQVVRRIFDLYVYDRLGFLQIARLLNREGISRRQQASRWHTSAVRDIVKHPAYKGEHPKTSCPAIVEPALFDLAQKRRGSNAHLHRRNRSPWLLQGMIKCGLCGRTLKCELSHGKNRFYVCRGRGRDTFVDDSHKCQLPWIPADRLEQTIWDRVSAALHDPEALEHELAQMVNRLEARKNDLEQAINPIEGKLKAAKAKLEKLAENWVMGALTDDKVARLKSELEQEVGRLEAAKAEVDPAQIEELTETKSLLDWWQEVAQKRYGATMILGFAELEDADGEVGNLGSPSTKRGLLDKLQCELWAYPSHIDIKALIPVTPIRHVTPEDVQLEDDTEYLQGCKSGYRSARCPRSR